MLGTWARAGTVFACVLLITADATARDLSTREISAGVAAFRAADQGEWDAAQGLIGNVKRPVAAKLLRWYRYVARDGEASFAEVARFVEANPLWPRRQLLLQRAEEAMQPALPARKVIAWFERFAPTSTQGRARYARALVSTGDQRTAARVARRAWVNGAFSDTSERAFLHEFGAFIEPRDHVKRLDWLLWRGRFSDAERMLSRVDPGVRALASARIALQTLTPGVDNAIARVPAELHSDPGLVYERVRWRRKKGLTDEAIELLLSSPGDQTEPRKWWIERQVLARQVLAEGRAQEAYRLASGHRLRGGASFAEAEWLAGWIALRFLKNPKAASDHFETLYDGVNYPISLARGAYWSGRAAEAAGDERKAQRWYATAAKHPATFYGQLAAGQLHIEKPLPLPPSPAPTAEERRAFQTHELVTAIHLLTAFGEGDLVTSFLIAVGAARDSEGWKSLAGSLAYELGRPELAIFVAKRAARNGQVLVDAGYPSVSVPNLAGDLPHAVEAPLVLAMIRQESAYRADAVSPAGARGLMQLMPATAQEVAAKLNVPYSKHRLVTDKAYNLTLGQRYISSMLAQFDGSYVLALAAYNAGPYRVRQWQEALGHPSRADLHRTIDWIELIPFAETRNYVQRILEHLQVYRGVANGGHVSPALLIRDLMR